MWSVSDVMASKIPMDEGESETVSVMAHGYSPSLCKKNTYLGGMYAVIQSVNKMVCAGVDYHDIKLSLQEYFEKLLDVPEKWGKVFSALLGALKVQTNLGISAIGGKDSMSGTYENMNVVPSLISFAAAVCPIDDVTQNYFKKADSTVVLLKTGADESGCMNFDAYKRVLDSVHKLIKEKKILSAKAVGYAGVVRAIADMSFGNKIGFSFAHDIQKETIFKDNYSDIILEVDSVSVLASLNDVSMVLGRTTEEEFIVFDADNVPLESLIKKWETPLSDVFPIRKDEEVKVQRIQTKNYTASRSTIKYAKPRVFIPVFPGTNCEYDTARAFEKAGAICDTFVFKNIGAKDIEDSVKEFVKYIKNAQIFMLPGGFSAADEPEGSGKFIVSVLKNPLITEALNELLYKRDGLCLGICNGFQALVKTGLLPYGKIAALEEDAPTLTFNNIARHVAKIIYTRISSNRSIWLNETKVGDVHAVAISHGEGRFVANEKHLHNLIANEQIAAQYCDRDGNVLGNGKINPNGSIYNIECITSPDGRILGKMGHSERTGSGLYKNIEGDFDQKIFLSGVRYYS